MSNSEYGVGCTREFSAARVTDSPPGMRAVVRWLRAMVKVYRQRNQLRELDARMLKDVGITPEQARAEASRRPWDLRGTSANGWVPGRGLRRERFDA